MPPRAERPQNLKPSLAAAVLRGIQQFGGTQAQLASTIGTKQPVVSRWCDPASDYVPNLLHLCAAPTSFAIAPLAWVAECHGHQVVAAPVVNLDDAARLQSEATRACLDLQRAFEVEPADVRRRDFVERAAMRVFNAARAVHAVTVLERRRSTP